MRIAHLADLHLGFRQYHRQNANGINQREADVAHALRAVVDVGPPPARNGQLTIG